MDGLLQQQLWCVVYNLTPSPNTHTRSFFLSHHCSRASVREPREPAAPWKPFLPSSLPLSSLPLSISSPASFFFSGHSCLFFLDDWVSRRHWRGRQRRKRRPRGENKQGHNWSAACRPLQTLPRRNAPGAAGRARVLMCLPSSTHHSVCVLCLWERGCLAPACRSKTHGAVGVYSPTCVRAPLHVHICHLSCVVLLHLISHRHALTTPFLPHACLPAW